ncbi:MAG: glucose-1-phosphate cytidylyltransferase [Chloroflexota bacterium]|nr:MAG: glucose-1-phosphate cytidylyltransferase [Chloroflexota bacterium]
MKVAILCGGKGTRLQEKTESIPKPLIEIGGRPILWHIMKIYSHYGFNDFVLLLGYKGEKIKEYFVDGDLWRRHNFTLATAPGCEPRIDYLHQDSEEWRITFVDTGQETNTGGRIKRAEPYIDGDTFMVTYGDGVADIDLLELERSHRQHGRIATITAVTPLSQFGLLRLDESGAVREFMEKPRMRDWVNGGFFVFQRDVFSFLQEDSILEREPLQHLAEAGEIVSYKHTGFWACMDTYKDAVTLDCLWNSKQARWKLWKD